MLELCEAWHNQMMHPGIKKQACMQHRFQYNEIGLYNCIKQVKKGFCISQS